MPDFKKYITWAHCLAASTLILTILLIYFVAQWKVDGYTALDWWYEDYICEEALENLSTEVSSAQVTIEEQQAYTSELESRKFELAIGCGALLASYNELEVKHGELLDAASDVVEDYTELCGDLYTRDYSLWLNWCQGV